MQSPPTFLKESRQRTFAWRKPGIMELKKKSNFFIGCRMGLQPSDIYTLPIIRNENLSPITLDKK